MTRHACLAATACTLVLIFLGRQLVGDSAARPNRPNGLAFHSSLTTATSGFYELLNTGTDISGTIYAPPNPGFNGSIMWIAGQTVGTDGAIAGGDNDTDLTDGVKSYAEYRVRLTSQGTYRVFWSGQRTATPQIVAEGTAAGNNDSVWIGGLNQDHAATTGWTQLNIAAGGISYRSTGALWIIDGSNVNTDLTLTIGIREDGPVYDRLALVLEGSGVDPNTLTTIPEPSSGVVLGVAAMTIVAACGVRCLRRRRKSQPRKEQRSQLTGRRASKSRLDPTIPQWQGTVLIRCARNCRACKCLSS